MKRRLWIGSGWKIKKTRMKRLLTGFELHLIEWRVNSFTKYHNKLTGIPCNPRRWHDKSGGI